MMGRRIDRLSTGLEAIFKGHIFNWLWRPARKRHNVRGEVYARTVQKYLSKHYLPSVNSMPYTSAEVSDDEKIYSIWLQGEQNAPDIVKACYASIRQHCSQQLVVLDREALRESISLPEVIWTKYDSGKIRNAHFADICRVELLHEYGGFWMDSTCLATGKIPEDLAALDFFLYRICSEGGFEYSFIGNSFIRARKGAFLLEAWRRMILDYWMNEDSAINYFQHQLMFKTIVEGDKRAEAEFCRMPAADQGPTHSVWWSIGDKPFDRNEFRKASSGAFFQKTTYIKPGHLIPGSVKDVMINKQEFL